MFKSKKCCGTCQNVGWFLEQDDIKDDNFDGNLICEKHQIVVENTSVCKGWEKATYLRTETKKERTIEPSAIAINRLSKEISKLNDLIVESNKKVKGLEE